MCLCIYYNIADKLSQVSHSYRSVADYEFEDIDLFPQMCYLTLRGQRFGGK